ncbi:MAG TPA: SGNH/GDSL hydrolase family protein [Trebonia sp.]|nr:SGNH/GDSL hydrolase family protein [Trebonia sp.]
MLPPHPLALLVRMLRSVAFLAIGVALGLAVGQVVPLAGRAWWHGVHGSDAARAARVTTARPDWVATWATSAQEPSDGAGPQHGFEDETVREIIYASVGGSAVRIRLTNLFGQRPLVIGAATVGAVLDGADLVPGTDVPLTFAGAASVTIPVGATVTSDPVQRAVTPLEELALSLYLPVLTGPPTNHLDAEQQAYMAPGNHAGDSAGSAFTTPERSSYYATEVDVRADSAPGTVVAFGDSITDGLDSDPGANDRWPNYLARRYDAALGASAPAVVDEGISGNRVLEDSACSGQSALNRFTRDALDVAGVRAVILMEGINDIGFALRPPAVCSTPTNARLTASQVEAGYRTLINLAHARGVKVYLGTLTPTNGTPGPSYWLRQQVNRWILASHAAGISDGVVDFQAALADPADPGYMAPAYNSGDNLHPGDLGYSAMADAVPLTWADLGVPR